MRNSIRLNRCKRYGLENSFHKPRSVQLEKQLLNLKNIRPPGHLCFIQCESCYCVHTDDDEFFDLHHEVSIGVQPKFSGRKNYTYHCHPKLNPRIPFLSLNRKLCVVTENCNKTIHQSDRQQRHRSNKNPV
jgi:hypothetical protein